MKERPILFSAPMVKAILEGRKSQTRRVVKSPHVTEADKWRVIPTKADEPTTWQSGIHGGGGLFAAGETIKCPYGQPGDRLWVRENVQAVEKPDGQDGVHYLADMTFRPIENTPQAAEMWLDLYDYGKTGLRGRVVPSIHMPRWASRLTLEIVNVRVERVQEISRRDANAEGVECKVYQYARLEDAPQDKFRELWDSINGQRPGCAWADNPWVWVVEFRKVTP